MRLLLLLLLLLAVALLLGSQHVEGSRSVESAYDSNKGVFSPQGRLVQLDYVEGLVKRGNLCMGAECKDGVVLMSDKLVSADASKLLVDGGVRRIYRVDSHVGILPAGLPADGRALVHKAMDYCRSHRREYGEPIPGRLLAERLGEFIHAACVRWGSRAYPNALFVACWEEGTPGDDNDDDNDDDDDDATGVPRLDSGGREGGGGDAGIADGISTPKLTVMVEASPGVSSEEHGEEEKKKQGGERRKETGGMERDDAGFQLYVVDPSGAVRRHSAACEGTGSSRARGWVRRRACAPGATPSEDSNTSSSSSSSSSTDDGEHGTTSNSEEDEEGENDESSGSSSEDREDGGEGAEAGWRQRQRRRRRREKLPLSEMTCAEAARAMVREARRIRGDGGRGGGRRSEDVAGLPEVAWLSIKRRKGRRGEPVFVHHRSVDDLFGHSER